MPQYSNSISNEEYSSFLKRPILNVGRARIAYTYKLSDKAAVIGDAAHAFPPSGIGATVAMVGA